MNLKINHRLGVVNVKYFNDVNINLKYDAIASTFGLKMLFDPKNKEHAEMACVSHYHECIVEHNGETLITGYLLSQSFPASSTPELITLGGSSKPGILEDSDIPTNVKGTPQAEYLQYDGLTLREIAQKIIAPFGLGLVIDGMAASDSSEPFTLDEKLDKKINSTTGSISQNIKSFLAELAVQRNIILSHDAKGNLLFTEAKTNQKPAFHVEVGVIATRITMTFNGQPIHSQITVLKQADTAGGNTDSNEFTIYNPYCPIIFRPKVVTQSSGDTNTIEDYAKNVLAAELKSITLVVEVDRWTVDDKMILPNTIITVFSPINYIYEKTKFFIESVNLKGNSEAQTATLNCVLPNVYNREYPKNIFVDAHSNFPRL